MSQIITNYSEFDKFLLKVIETTRDDMFYHAFSSIRTLYSISYFNQNVRFIELLKIIPRSVVFVIKALFFKRRFNRYENAVIYGNTIQDKIVSKRTSIPTVCLIKEYRFLNIFKNYKIIINLIRVILLCFRSNLNKRYLFTFIPYIIDFFTVYNKVEFKNIKNIITENDVMVKEYALITSANKQNIRTIKVDYFIIDDIYSNKINCNYYYYPNSHHKNLLGKFTVNRNIKYVEGGYPSWDELDKYINKNETNKTLPKKIIYFTQHSLVDNKQKIYIKSLIDILEKLSDSLLIIKVHPRDKTDYSYITSSKVEIFKDQNLNYELISQAFATFSIFSGLTLEAKHICSNSFFINFDIENNNFPIEYNAFKGYIDVIENQEMLLAVINGLYKTSESDLFINKFNPAFPHSCDKLKEILI